MPIIVVCSECGQILYESGNLKTPSDVMKPYDGKCPKCNRTLNFSADRLSIYPYEEKEEREKISERARVSNTA